MHRILPLLIGVIVTPLPAQRSDTGRAATDATLDRAIHTYQAAKTLKATFEQTLTNPLTGSSSRAHGELIMRKPNQLSVRFLDPDGDRIVADGAMLWVYLPSQNAKQVIRVPQGKAGMGGIDVIGQFFDSPRTRFTITDAGALKIGERATHALRMVPKKATGTFAQAIVWIEDDGGQLRQFEVTDANGLVRRVSLGRVDVNGKIDPATFQFMMPRGAKLVDQFATP